MRLPSGFPFPLPITLDVPETFKVTLNGGCVSLLDVYSNPVAKLLISDLYRPNRTLEAFLCYGDDSDTSHPGIEYLLHYSGPIYMGGELIRDRGVFTIDFPNLRLDPIQVKREISSRNATSIVAFQTRNPLHVAHVDLIIQSLSFASLVLLHPVVGPTKPDDVPYPVRVQTYLALLSHGSLAPYKDRILLSLLPLAMRFGGPREAVLHMLIRKNFGATHFVIGRDHAGCKRRNGTDFYTPTAAAIIAAQFAPELGITLLSLKSRHDVSASRLRDLLASGSPVPSDLADPVVVEILQKLYPPLPSRALVILIVGLSGSGKTTLALSLRDMIESAPISRPVSLLDGDAIRKRISPDLGFSKSDRIQHLSRILFIATEIAHHQGLVIVSTIAPYRSVRRKFRNSFNTANFVLVHLNTTFAQCVERDTKGLYAEQVATITGALYEAPDLGEADLTFNGSGGLPEVFRMSNEIIRYLVEKKFLREIFVCPSESHIMIVEIPKFSKNKIEYKNGQFILDRTLQHPDPIPVNYGFIPDTIGFDGDPIDIVEIGIDTLTVGQKICVYVIGILWFTDDGHDDHKLVATSLPDNTVYDASRLKEIQNWFLTYKQYEGKSNLELKLRGPKPIEYIEHAHNLWKTTRNGLGRAQIEFVAYGDWGNTSQDLKDTIASIKRMSPNRNFNILLGDNFYPGGVNSVNDPQFSMFTDIVLGDTKLPHHLLLGNHDYVASVDAQIQYSQVNSYWDLPSRYYKRTYSIGGVNVCLIMIDTIQWDSTQVAWINTQLQSPECNTQNAWTIVNGHYPIWAAGAYSNNASLNADLVPLLHQYGVQLYLCGHEHNHGIFYDGKVVEVHSGAVGLTRSAITFKQNSKQIWGVSGTDVVGYIRLSVSQTAIDVAITSSRSDGDFQTFTITRGATAQSMFGHINWSASNSNADAFVAHNPRGYTTVAPNTSKSAPTTLYGSTTTSLVATTTLLTTSSGIATTRTAKSLFQVSALFAILFFFA